MCCEILSHLPRRAFHSISSSNSSIVRHLDGFGAVQHPNTGFPISAIVVRERVKKNDVHGR